MKVIKKNTKYGTDIFLECDDKYISFTFRGNLDLYWMIHRRYNNNINDNYKYDYFIITKENYNLYKLFENLFYNIENINIFDLDSFIPSYIDENDKTEYLKERKKEIEKVKNSCRLYNNYNYNELFDVNNNIITWYSDKTASKVSNILKIRKGKNEFKIEFYTQSYVDGYDEDFHSINYIPIRFRNSGSRYNPFNQIFMKMYNDMNNIDDINDEGHQICIEEYLYNKKKTKKLTK